MISRSVGFTPPTKWQPRSPSSKHNHLAHHSSSLIIIIIIITLTHHHSHSSSLSSSSSSSSSSLFIIISHLIVITVVQHPDWPKKIKNWPPIPHILVCDNRSMSVYNIDILRPVQYQLQKSKPRSNHRSPNKIMSMPALRSKIDGNTVSPWHNIVCYSDGFIPIGHRLHYLGTELSSHHAHRPLLEPYPPNKSRNWEHPKKVNARWFEVTLLSPSWRPLNPWKGHLGIPKRAKKVTKNRQVHAMNCSCDSVRESDSGGQFKPVVCFCCFWCLWGKRSYQLWFRDSENRPP